MRKDPLKLRPKAELYIACEEMDFSWNYKEIEKVIVWWGRGLSIEKMAQRLERDPDEVLILLVDLARKEKIGRRKNGIFGEERFYV